MRAKMNRSIALGATILLLMSLAAYSQSYEEIMAEIARYPGPDEPLYAPSEEEAIWLTDLEGHADIYDNDSIRINYADSFDRTRVNKIEVYRNGHRMRFLPELFDVLESFLMKTFDGHPNELSPTSSHTDHSILGYEYEFLFFDEYDALLEVQSAQVLSRFRLPTEYRYLNLMEWNEQGAMSLNDLQLETQLAKFRRQGWNGISLDYWLFLPSDHANDLSVFYNWSGEARSTTGGLETPTDEELRRILIAAERSGMEVEVRVCMYVSEEYKDANPDTCGRGCRSELIPDDPALFFANYTEYCLHVAEIMEEYGADLLTVLVEAVSLELYENHVERLLTDVSSTFSGRLAVDQQTHVLFKWPVDPLRMPYAEGIAGIKEYLDLSRFWDWTSGDGRTVDILMNSIDPTLETQADQRYSVMVEYFHKQWKPIVDYYKTKYPQNRLAFGEIAVSNKHGAVAKDSGAPDSPFPLGVRDFQEEADVLAAMCTAISALGVDGISFEYGRIIWTRSMLKEPLPHVPVLDAPVHRVLAATLGTGYTLDPERDAMAPLSIDYSELDSLERIGNATILFDEMHGSSATLLWGTATSDAAGNDLLPEESFWNLRQLEPRFAVLPQSEPLEYLGDISGALAIAFCTPSHELTLLEQETIRRYLAQGGSVIVFGNARHQLPQSFEALLAEYGLALDPSSTLPSGTAQSSELGDSEVVIDDGQAVVFQPTDGVEVLLRARFRGYPQAWALYVVRSGGGIIAVIGDNEFSVDTPDRPDSMMNLAGSTPGQVNFLGELLSFIERAREGGKH